MYRDRASTELIVLHDTHTMPYAGEHFIRYNGRKLGLVDIGYHFLVDGEGEVIETRPPSTVGSHCNGFNRVSIGIGLVGSVAADFTRPMLVGLSSLVLSLWREFGHVPVNGHTELKRYKDRHHSRPCPNLDMGLLRKDLHEFYACTHLWGFKHRYVPAEQSEPAGQAGAGLPPEGPQTYNPLSPHDPRGGKPV
jgi:hypothetical protein